MSPFGSPSPAVGGVEEAHDQVQPLDLAPGVPEIQLRPRALGVEAPVLFGVEQAVEVEGRRPLVFGLQDRLRVLQADFSYVLGERTVGAGQGLRRGLQPAVGGVYLPYERVAFRRPSPLPVSAAVRVSHTLSGSLVPRWLMWPHAS